jgi:hypothetical protein
MKKDRIFGYLYFNLIQILKNKNYMTVGWVDFW